MGGGGRKQAPLGKRKHINGNPKRNMASAKDEIVQCGECICKSSQLLLQNNFERTTNVFIIQKTKDKKRYIGERWRIGRVLEWCGGGLLGSG